MRHRSPNRLIFWGLFALPPMAFANPPDSFGRWASADGAVVIDVTPCGAEVCGVIVAFQPEEYPVRDQYNPRTELRQRPMCGLRVLGGRLSADQRWMDGWVYDASDGTHYRVSNVATHDEQTLVIDIQYGIIMRSLVLHRAVVKTLRCKTPRQLNSSEDSRR